MTSRYTLTPSEARVVHTRLIEHCQALKNWIASAVERGEADRARELVTELRTCEQLAAKLAAKLNVEVHERLVALSADPPTVESGA